MGRDLFEEMERRECIVFDEKTQSTCTYRHVYIHGKQFELKRKDNSTKKYDFVSEFYEGCACVELNGKQGFVNELGQEICDLKYKNWCVNSPNYKYEPHTLSYTLFSDGYAKVAIEDELDKSLKFGYINKDGVEVCPLVYRQCSFFYDGHAIVVKENGKSVVINKEFKEISKEYDSISYFINGYARVEIKGKYGYIDDACNEICAIKFDSAGNFKAGHIAQASIKERREYLQYVDNKGREYYMDEFGIILPYDTSNLTKYKYDSEKNIYYIYET